MKISIVTPSFNQGQFIGRTLQSVASQSGAEIEHVVFDGGSSDDTVDVLKQFGHGVRWTSEKDNGQTDAINKGILATNGEIIGWLNSDDVYYPGAIAAAVAFFEANPDVDVVYGMADHIDLADYAFEPYPTAAWDFDTLKDRCFICQPAAFFRRRVIQRYGLLNENLHFCMDYEFWLRLGAAGARFSYLEQKLAGSRLYAENKTMGFRLKVAREIVRMEKSSLGSVSENWIWHYAHAIVEQWIDQSKKPILFGFLVHAVIVPIILRWNGRMSPAMRRRLVTQAKHHVFSPLRGLRGTTRSD